MTPRGWLVVTVLLLAGLLSSVSGSDLRQDWERVQDSLHRVPPKQREWWLKERGLGDLLAPQGNAAPESVGLSMVGKWGRGPSVEVTGQDTLVALSLGSEVALLSFADPDNPRVLSEIQLSSMAGQAQLAGSLLYINSTGAFEVWDISNPTSPALRGRIPYGIGDFWVNDTFLYFIKNDTFKVLSVADPASPRLIGCYRDSGYFLAATPTTAVLGDPDAGLYFVDITNPASPRRVGSFPAEIPRSAAARGSLCCATFESRVEPYPIRFITIDLTDPASPRQLGQLNNAGGYDLYLDSSLAFASGRGVSDEPFHIISIQDSTSPSLVGQYATTTRYSYGVWASLRADRAFVADEWDGLAVVNVASLSNPQLDTFVLVAASAEDVFVDGNICYVADGQAGLKILDVSDPTNPRQIGEVDTAYEVSTSYSVVARDSFAYTSFYYPWFRSVDVSDPASPRIVGGCFPPEEEPQAMILRDSLVYVVLHSRFEVLSVARPREPRLIGSCRAGSENWGVELQDTLSYIGSWSGLVVVNVARPREPVVVSTTPGTRTSTYDVAVRDTFVYVPSGFETLWVFSAADPLAPRALGGVPLQGERGFSADLVDDTLLLVGCLHSAKLVSVADPASPRIVGSYPTPSVARRVKVAEPYLYVCCVDAGVIVLETTAVGISEPELAGLGPRGGQPTLASPVTEALRLPGASPSAEPRRLSIYDVSGRKVLASEALGSGSARVDVASLRSGLYILEVSERNMVLRYKFAKQ